MSSFPPLPQVQVGLACVAHVTPLPVVSPCVHPLPGQCRPCAPHSQSRPPVCTPLLVGAPCVHPPSQSRPTCVHPSQSCPTRVQPPLLVTSPSCAPPSSAGLPICEEGGLGRAGPYVEHGGQKGGGAKGGGSPACCPVRVSRAVVRVRRGGRTLRMLPHVPHLCTEGGVA